MKTRGSSGGNDTSELREEGGLRPSGPILYSSGVRVPVGSEMESLLGIIWGGGKSFVQLEGFRSPKVGGSKPYQGNGGKGGEKLESQLGKRKKGTFVYLKSSYEKGRGVL